MVIMENKSRPLFVISLGLTILAAALRAGVALGEFARGRDTLSLTDGLLALAVVFTLVTGVQSVISDKGE